MKTEHFFSEYERSKKEELIKVLVTICGANLGPTHPDEQFFGLNLAYQPEDKPVLQDVFTDMGDIEALFEVCNAKSEKELIGKRLWLYMDESEDIKGFEAAQ